MIRVVIFEDNRSYRDGLTGLIETTDDLCLAGSHKDCNDVLNDIRKEEPDVVLMDISMPGMSGIDAVAMIKGKFPRVQVLMQTVFEQNEKVFAAICAGASGYILKNSEPEKLLTAIREVHSGGAAFTPSIARKVLNMFQEQTRELSTEDYKLSPREKEILQHLSKGMSYKMIASECNIRYETVHTHIKKIYEKLHVSSMSEAVAKAIRNKIV